MFSKKVTYLFVLVILLMLGSVGLGENIKTYGDLESTIEECTNDSLVVEIQEDLIAPDTQTGAINVPSGLTSLTIRLNGHKITGNGKCGFLKIENCTLVLENSKNQANHTSYSDETGLSVDTTGLGTINKFYGGEGGVIFSPKPSKYHLDWQSNVTIKDLVFIENNASNLGGVICLYRDALTVAGCVFQKSIVDSDSGGAIYVYESTSATNISYCVFEDNKACESGGAVCAYDSDLTITKCKFENNQISEDGTVGGGAIYHGGQNIETEINVSFSDFVGNSVTGEDEQGGAIYTEMYSDVTIDHCNFEQNSAYYGGGAIFQTAGSGDDPGKMTVSHSMFKSNSSYNDDDNGRGGAINTGSNATIIDCQFTENSADSGGAIFVRGFLYLSDNTILNYNNAGYGGGIGIDQPWDSTLLDVSLDSKIYNNSATEAGSDIYIYDATITINSLPEAASMNVNYLDSGQAIGAWFKDESPRYNINDASTQHEYSIDDIKAKVLEVNGVSLIAAPKQTSSSKVIYDPNGGQGTIDPTEGNIGSDVTIAENKFTYPYCTFANWNTEAYGTGKTYAPGDSYTLTGSDLTLYAQWIAPVTIIKIWDDADNKENKRPPTLNTQLVIGSEAQADVNGKTVFPLTEDQITHVWSTTVDLPAKDYSALWAEEEEVPGYEQADCRRSVTSNGTLKFVFENRHEVSEFRVYKEWVGIDGEPPEISLHLYNKDVRLPDKPVMRDNWYIWKLPIADNDGNPEYYVLEEPMRGFMTEYLHNGELADCARNGDTIRNTLVPLTGERHPLVFWLTVLAATGFGLMLCRRRK